MVYMHGTDTYLSQIKSNYEEYRSYLVFLFTETSSTKGWYKHMYRIFMV